MARYHMLAANTKLQSSHSLCPTLLLWSQYQRISAFLSISTNQFRKHGFESRYHCREQIQGYRVVQQCTSPTLDVTLDTLINSILRNRGLVLSGEKLNPVRLLCAAYIYTLLSQTEL